MPITTSSATVKGGLFETNGVATLTPQQGKSSWRRLVSIAFGRKTMMAERSKLFALMGVAPGATASKTLGRVQAATELGGARVVEQETLYNAATDAADVTEAKQDFLGETLQTTFAASPVANLDGNPLGTR
jgi:hypothetical protein